MKQSKTVQITSILPALPHDIWQKLQRLDTLQYIAAPYATFTPLQNEGPVWQVGATSRFALKIFGFLPMGVHSIYVKTFDPALLRVDTQESNPSVPVWNHRIVLEDLGNGSTHYTDQVEIQAGWKTIFVYWWSCLFYRHRQKKWLKLLQKDK